jgi:hypothetical protein
MAGRRTNSRPITNAWANPLGSGCSAYENAIPHCAPSPRSSRKRGRSCGVEMTSTSRIPASISVVRG